MRLCIIGNSHIAALKGGWEAGVKAEFPGICLTFFGARGGGLTKLMVRGGTLTSDDAKIRSDLAFTSGGQIGIDPRLFDAFLVYGLCRNVNRQVRNYGAGYTRQVLESALLDYWAATSLIGVIRKLREITTLPIHAGASPLEAALGAASSNTSNYARFLDDSNQQVFALLGAALIGQPLETIVNGDATALAFASGSARLAVGAGNDLVPHQAGETRHMNADFGAKWLRHFLIGLMADDSDATGMQTP
ncbi:MAG: hypothetical protein KDK00_14020 [Rhodobacteraceae bacterium]|nr:hypothetical protein [Paracoccaceae bacterium]